MDFKVLKAVVVDVSLFADVPHNVAHWDYSTRGYEYGHGVERRIDHHMIPAFVRLSIEEAIPQAFWKRRISRRRRLGVHGRHKHLLAEHILILDARIPFVGTIGEPHGAHYGHSRVIGLAGTGVDIGKHPVPEFGELPAYRLNP